MLRFAPVAGLESGFYDDTDVAYLEWTVQDEQDFRELLGLAEGEDYSALFEPE